MLNLKKYFKSYFLTFLRQSIKNHNQKLITYKDKNTFTIKTNNNKFNIVFPDNKTNGLKIHLGSGEINLQGWVNIDARKFNHTHLVSQDFSLKEFKNNSVEQIYLCHVLEHFSFKDSPKLLEVIKNKLKLSGIVRISVPNFKQIVKIYNASKDLNIIKNALMGGQSYNNDFHRSVYDFKEIYDLLRELGFKKIMKWNPKFFFKTSVGDWSEYKYVVRGRSYPISINIQATK